MSKIIIINREESKAMALRLGDHLSNRFGAQTVTVGSNKLTRLGEDYVEAVEDRVLKSDAVIVLIGPHFLEGAWSRDEEQTDRLAIRAALRHNKRLIPVLVEGGAMPTAADLDEALAPLARRAPLTVTETGFRGDVAPLIQMLEQFTSPAQPAPAAPSTGSYATPSGFVIGAAPVTTVMTSEKRKNETFGPDSYELADFGARFAAGIIDGILVNIAAVVAGVIIGVVLSGTTRSASTAQAIGGIIGLVLGAGYQIYFLTRTGQTIGKQILGVKVVKEDGRLLNTGEVILRIIGQIVGSLFLLIGYIWALFDQRRQGWHDKFAGSLVIKASSR